VLISVLLPDRGDAETVAGPPLAVQISERTLRGVDAEESLGTSEGLATRKG
jgi:hypothetical protein